MANPNRGCPRTSSSLVVRRQILRVSLFALGTILRVGALRRPMGLSAAEGFMCVRSVIAPTAFCSMGLD